MTVQLININATRNAAQQDNKQLLSVKQYSDCIEKTYLVPAKTPEQKLAPVLYSAICPGLGQEQNGESAKSRKFIGATILSSLGLLCGLGLAINAKSKTAKAKFLSGVALMGLSIVSGFFTWMYSVVDAYKNAKTEVVEITQNTINGY